MNISEAAERAGLPTKTIRYYEDIGLVEPARRRDNGYRDYTDRDVHMLSFLSRARGLGFSVADCRALVALYADKGRKSADVKEIALNRVTDIDAKIAELRAMRATLVDLAENCHGDGRPDCPIIDELAERLAG
ncbi:MAG: Cu(I)-responsive transcriptional regulator [Alphaproteobacteria bacterium]|nr:Cu(I)-responsive transcriptional regulator [Alphaproteobacteria bacterium]